ncbi:MAG TPA: hypothetical protein VMN39_12415, partial [Longimicrobiaceae bacterium]|nr:hypothetical protein [Longimicrobiaceae bacterium]
VVRSGRLRDLPLWKTHMSGFLGNPLCVVLWLVGIAQSYRLFDWVDTRNYHVRYELREVSAAGDVRPAKVDPEVVFPTSLRHRLLQSYLVGNVWLQLEEAQLETLKRTLLERHARRLARLRPDAGTIDVYAIVQRVTSDNLRLERGERRHLARFDCRGGRAAVIQPLLTG